MKRRLLSGLATGLLYAVLVLLAAALGVEPDLTVFLVIGLTSLLVVTVVWRFVLPRERSAENGER